MYKTFLLVGLLLSLSLSAAAQEGFLPEFSERDKACFRVMLNPMLRAMFAEGADRGGIFIALLTEMPLFPGFKEEFGITTEQRMQFNSTVNDPTLMPEEIKALGDRLFSNIDLDANYVPTEEEDAAIEATYMFYMERMNTAAADTFTEEQMQRMNNVVFALTGGLQSPFLSETHMAALDLTGEQKAQFNKINEEMKPERDKMLATFDADIQKMIKTGKISVKDFFSALSRFRNLGVDLKKRRMEVLTRAQIAKATEMARLPKSMTLSVFNVVPAWTPSTDSWKPGDPLPEGARPVVPAPGRFPRTETE